MLTTFKKYLASVGSNVRALYKASMQAVSGLIGSEAVTKIAQPLTHISLTDFLPAAIAFGVNESLQNSFDEYEEQLTDEAMMARAVLALSASATNVAFLTFILGRVTRGGIRTVALIMTIPQLFNEENLEVLPRGEVDDLETIVLNSKRIEQTMYLMGECLFDTGVNILLPEHYLLQAALKLLMGYEIVSNALDENTLKRLDRLKVNSLPLLVGSTFLLGTLAKDLALQTITNPYLHLLIDNSLFISLFAVVANLKLNTIHLEEESYSLNPSAIIRHSHPERVLHSLFRKTVKQITREQWKNISILLNAYPEISLITIKTLGGPMFQSPEAFFDDPVISELLQSLPSRTRSYLFNKYSSTQIETLISHFEVAVTHRRAQHTQAICGFFAIRRWSDAFRSKLQVYNEYDAIADVIADNATRNTRNRHRMFTIARVNHSEHDVLISSENSPGAATTSEGREAYLS